jgi:hypothetical protein
MPRAVNLGFIDLSSYISINWAINNPHEAEFTSLEFHYFSEKAIVHRIVPETLGSVASNCDHYLISHTLDRHNHLLSLLNSVYITE